MSSGCSARTTTPPRHPFVTCSEALLVHGGAIFLPQCTRSASVGGARARRVGGARSRRGGGGSRAGAARAVLTRGTPGVGDCRRSQSHPRRKPMIVDSAEVDPTAQIGTEASVWQLAQVRENAVVGQGFIIGRGAYIGSGVHLGDNCKVQNYALIYEPAHLEDGVFIGPAAVLTTDPYPRAINSDGTRKSGADWEPVGVTLRRGASVGARAVCVAPVTIGAWATVAAGAVVTKDVPDHALVAGVPA